MGRSINWFGLSAGITTLIVLVISFYVPWWQLTIGENLIKVNASPVITNFGLFGTQFTVPLIWALNLISILTFTACGLVMLIYSLNPTKSYSKHLLGFSYKKPLYVLIFFVAILVAIIVIAGFIGMNIPLMGSTTLSLPTQFISSGLNIRALVSGSFQLPFYLAIAAAALCIAARLYHKNLAKTLKTGPETATSPTETTAPSVTA
ncbi:MAG: hypothetical protein ABSD42_12330 [Candidatus Bathyarchaeia archaeon]|jgi:hypothetical protein